MNKCRFSSLGLVASLLAALVVALPVAAQMAAPAASTAPAPAAAASATVPVLPPAATRASPHETISTHIGNARSGPLVTVVYGRPYSKAPRGGDVRKIWGSLIPWGKEWRVGSDEATLFITQVDLVMGTTTIPAGAYTLDMMPVENGTSQLIFLKRVGQWGIPYDAADKAAEFAHVDLKKDTIEKQVDQFTMAIINDTTTGGGVLKLQWETTQYSVAFTLKK